MKSKEQRRGYFLYPLFFFLISGVIIWLDIPRRYLIWNLLLAFAPYVFTEVALAWENSFVKVILTLLALLFFPNAIYIFTDFIHFSSTHFYTVEGYEVTYLMDIRHWVSYCLTYLSAVLGATLSFEVTRNFCRLLGLRREWLRGLFTLLLAFPVGLALYWGRFLRFNSWNLFHKPQILWENLRSLTWTEGRYILLFGGTYLAVTALFAAATGKKNR